MDPREAILQRLSQGEASVSELATWLKVTRRTVFRYVKELVNQGKIMKVGKWHGLRYIKADRQQGAKGEIRKNQGEGLIRQFRGEPPLLQVRVTNPVTYLKRWWSKVMANEGVDVRFRIRPLTMMAISAVLASGGFVFGRISLPEPVVRYIPQLAPSPSPNPWKETAFTGVLQERGGKYYLTTGEGEAIRLEVPSIVNIKKMNGRKILAIGSYNTMSKILRVIDASDMEVLVGAQPAPLVATPAPEHPSSGAELTTGQGARYGASGSANRTNESQ